MSYGTDRSWSCPCGARSAALCQCQRIAAEAPVREALYGRLKAQGIRLDTTGLDLPLETLAAVLVAVEDPFWAEGDSARTDDAATMIHLIRRELNP